MAFLQYRRAINAVGLYLARLAELKSDAASLTYRFGGQFETWARAEAGRRRRRTVTLLQGSVSFRTVAPRFSFRQGSDADVEAFVHARTAFPDCIVTAAPKLDKAAYLAHAESTGEVLPGLETVPARESVSLKFGGKPSGKPSGGQGDEE